MRRRRQWPGARREVPHVRRRDRTGTDGSSDHCTIRHCVHGRIRRDSRQRERYRDTRISDRTGRAHSRWSRQSRLRQDGARQFAAAEGHWTWQRRRVDRRHTRRKGASGRQAARARERSLHTHPAGPGNGRGKRRERDRSRRLSTAPSLSYFVVTKPDGAFTIDGVPAGKHTLGAWHERTGRSEQSVEVPANGSAKVALSLRGK